MYKIGIALLAIFAVMVIPAQGSSEDGRPTYYGMGTIVLNDQFGNEVFSQELHNIVVDTGESFIILQTFKNGTATSDSGTIGAICLTENGSFSPAETDTAATFDSGTTITGPGLECKEASSVSESPQGKAVIGPLTFNTSNLDAVNETITGIGVCQATVADDNDFGTCASNGILFAEIDTTNVQLNTGETVQITYTFDITSSGT